MRLMSFAATVPQMRARTKTVTRRLGWTTLKAGDQLLACAKTRGVKVEDREELGVIEVVSVRREPLDVITWPEPLCFGHRGHGHRVPVRGGRRMTPALATSPAWQVGRSCSATSTKGGGQR